MHNAGLGSWRAHVEQVMYTYNCHLLRWLDVEGSPIIGSAQREQVWQRLSERLKNAGAHTPTLLVSDWIATSPARTLGSADAHQTIEQSQQAHHAYNEGKAYRNGSSGGIRATEEAKLMMILPYCLANLITPEITIINAYYRDHPQALELSLSRQEEAISQRVNELKHQHAKRLQTERQQSDESAQDSSSDSPTSDMEIEGSKPSAEEQWEPSAEAVGKVLFLRGLRTPHDPSEDIVQSTMEWCQLFVDLKKGEFDDESREDLETRIVKWKERVLLIFPFKSGQHAGQNFQKNHEWDHATDNIRWIGSLNNLSAQTPEHCHQYYVKRLSAMTNRQQGWEKQVMDKLVTRDVIRALWSVPLGEDDISDSDSFPGGDTATEAEKHEPSLRETHVRAWEHRLGDHRVGRLGGVWMPLAAFRTHQEHTRATWVRDSRGAIQPQTDRGLLFLDTLGGAGCPVTAQCKDFAHFQTHLAMFLAQQLEDENPQITQLPPPPKRSAIDNNYFTDDLTELIQQRVLYQGPHASKDATISVRANLRQPTVTLYRRVKLENEKLQGCKMFLTACPFPCAPWRRKNTKQVGTSMPVKRCLGLQHGSMMTYQYIQKWKSTLKRWSPHQCRSNNW